MALDNSKNVLGVDISAYEKNMSAAAEMYRKFIEQTENNSGFKNTSKALSELTNMVAELAKLEEWSAAEKIAGYEKLQGVFEGNMRAQMSLEIKLHELKKAQIKEEFDEQMQRVKSLDNGNDAQTDYSNIINEYEKLKQAHLQNADDVSIIDEKIVAATTARKNKILDIRKSEVDETLNENRRQFEMNKEFHADDGQFAIDFYKKQIEVGRVLINDLEAQGGELTTKQKTELDKKLEQEADYYGKINKLSLEAISKAKESAGKIAEAELQIVAAKNLAIEQRKTADLNYFQEVEKVNEQRLKDRIDAEQEYEQQVRNVQSALIEDEQRLNDAFDKTFQAKKNQISNFAGIFDGVQDREVSGTQLVDNLKSQVDAMAKFQESIKLLEGRGITGDLLNDLTAMGPSKASEISALTTLTNEELQSYLNAYNEKNAMAEKFAYDQTDGQREKLAADIAASKQKAEQSVMDLSDKYYEKLDLIDKKTSESLLKLSGEWQKSLTEISTHLTTELDVQQQVIDKNSASNIESFRKTATVQKQVETEKTANVERENDRQENDVRLTQMANIDTLRNSVPTWSAIGYELGNSLLAGIQSTRSGIIAYLDDVARSVANAKNGTSSDVGSYASESFSTFSDESFGFQTLQSFDSSYSFSSENQSIDYNVLAQTLAEVLPQQQSVLNYNPVYNSPQTASISELKQQDKLNLRRLGLGL